MYSRSFLCEKAKIKQRTPLKKELCEIGKEAMWESRFTSFLYSIQFDKRFVKKRWLMRSARLYPAEVQNIRFFRLLIADFGEFSFKL